jgi:hypothetical protein
VRQLKHLPLILCLNKKTPRVDSGARQRRKVLPLLPPPKLRSYKMPLLLACGFPSRALWNDLNLPRRTGRKIALAQNQFGRISLQNGDWTRPTKVRQRPKAWSKPAHLTGGGGQSPWKKTTGEEAKNRTSRCRRSCSSAWSALGVEYFCQDPCLTTSAKDLPRVIGIDRLQSQNPTAPCREEVVGHTVENLLHTATQHQFRHCCRPLLEHQLLHLDLGGAQAGGPHPVHQPPARAWNQHRGKRERGSEGNGEAMGCR